LHFAQDHGKSPQLRMTSLTDYFRDSFHAFRCVRSNSNFPFNPNSKLNLLILQAMFELHGQDCC
jgi:hypothetical protein